MPAARPTFTVVIRTYQRPKVLALTLESLTHQTYKNFQVLVVEDGPTLTHGGMKIGAGWVAARRFGAAEIVDPRPFAVGTIADTYKKYPNTGTILPAMGYGEQQVRDLEKTIEDAPVDMVVIGTPIDLTRVMKINKPSQRVRYELEEIGQPTLVEILTKKFGPKA